MPYPLLHSLNPLLKSTSCFGERTDRRERQEKNSKAGGVLVMGTNLIPLYRSTIEVAK
jgi:hypothetical protein